MCFVFVTSVSDLEYDAAWQHDEICGRCDEPIPDGESETCWFCNSPLCVTCWDRYGHCGHAEADEINTNLSMQIGAEKAEN
jgi:hypothetical protein